MKSNILKIVSGGQTGADRAGLDWATRAQIPHGGWCPAGRRAEDGAVPARYQLTEAPFRDYTQRTMRNVRDSDGTAIFSCHPSLSGGSALTQKTAQDLSRPMIHVHAGLGIENAGKTLRDFVQRHGIRILNIAGPRASHEPDVAAFVGQVLSLAFIDCPTLPIPAQVLACLRLGYLESAQQLMRQAHVMLEPQDLDAILQDLESQAAMQQAQEDPRQTKRIGRRILALTVFREHGLDQEQLIRPVDLPEGYTGKILLIGLHGARLGRKTPSSARERAIFLPDKDGEADDVCSIVDTAGCRQADKGPLEAKSGFPTEPTSEGTLCLRSGDLWHREILRETEEEIADLGFDLTTVSPMGGAWVRFDEDQVITLYGSSDDYGECDKQLAAQLIAGVYLQHDVCAKP